MVNQVIYYVFLLFDRFCPPYAKKAAWEQIYEKLAEGPSRGWAWQVPDFMNLGYSDLDPQTQVLDLEEGDEINRCYIRLYHHVATTWPVNFRNAEVLEVGCGHGGGASYVQRYLRPKRVIGFDISEKSVGYCRKRHSMDGLGFQQGDAESMPFDDSRFDIILNVESSHCYPSMTKFLREIRRVLRPGGYFLFCDLRFTYQVEKLKRQMRESGMRTLKAEDITANILKARGEDHGRLMQRTEGLSTIMRAVLRESFAAKSSEMYRLFALGRRKYLVFVLQKPY